MFPNLGPGSVFPAQVIKGIAELASMARTQRAKVHQGAIPKGRPAEVDMTPNRGITNQGCLGGPPPAYAMAAVHSMPMNRFPSANGGEASKPTQAAFFPTWEYYDSALRRSGGWELDPISWSQTAEQLPLLGFVPAVHHLIQTSLNAYAHETQILWDTQVGRVVHKLDTQQVSIDAGRTHAQSVDNQLASHTAAIRELSGHVQGLIGQMQQTNAVLEQMAAAMNQMTINRQSSPPAPTPAAALPAGFAPPPPVPSSPAQPAMPDAVAQLLAQARSPAPHQNPFGPSPLAPPETHWNSSSSTWRASELRVHNLPRAEPSTAPAAICSRTNYAPGHILSSILWLWCWSRCESAPDGGGEDARYVNQ